VSVPAQRGDGRHGRRRRNPGPTPYKALLIRGEASVDKLEDLSPEYEKAAYRYFGDEAAQEWLKQLRGTPMARIAVTPEWVCLLDFVTRFPSALSA
jgi:hypothetical protein